MTKKEEFMLNSGFTWATVMAALIIVLTGACEQALDIPKKIEMPRISINSNKEIAIVAPTSVEFHDSVFVPPDDVKITIANEWDRETGMLNILLNGSGSDYFSVFPGRIDNLLPGESTTVTLKISPTDPRRPVTYKVDLLVGNEDAYQKLPITYNVYTFALDDGIVLEPAELRAGISGTPKAIVRAAQGAGRWISFNPSVAAIDNGGILTILADGTALVGYLTSANNGSPLYKGKKITVKPAVWAETINEKTDAETTRVKVNFSEPLSAAGNIEGLSASLFNVPVAVQSAVLNNDTITVTLAAPIGFDDKAEIVYSGSGNLRDRTGAALDRFTAPVANTITVNNIVNITRPYADVSASNVHSDKYPAANAVDEVASTRWATTSATRACTLTLAYSGNKKVKKAVIASYEARISKFNIEYSVDGGGTWQIAYSYSGSAVPGSKDGSKSESFTFAAVTANQFRLNILETSADPSIWEFELWGSNSQ